MSFWAERRKEGGKVSSRSSKEEKKGRVRRTHSSWKSLDGRSNSVVDGVHRASVVSTDDGRESDRSSSREGRRRRQRTPWSVLCSQREVLGSKLVELTERGGELEGELRRREETG